MSPTTTFEHIGSVKQSDGVLRIDIKSMQAVIGRSDVDQLLHHIPVDIYDMADVICSCGEPEVVGKAWITRSGKAIMYRINGLRYVSPLAQVKGLLDGSRKFAHVAIMIDDPASASGASSSAQAGVAA